MRHTLFILDYFHPFIGGIETLFDAVTTFCSEKNMKVTVLTSRHSPDLKKIEKRGNVTIYRVGRNRFTTFFSVLGFVLNNRELIQSVDHIHTSTFTSSIPAWIVGKIYHKPTTITIHEIYNTLRYHLKGRKAIFYIWFEWIVCHLRWKKIITVSQSSKDMIQKTYPKLNHENVSVILNQIDTNFWNREQVNINQQDALKHVHNISVSDTLLLFVGRLGYEKGLPYLIEAFSQIKDDYPDTKMVIIAPHTKQQYNDGIQNQIHSIEQQIKDNYLTKHIIRIDPVQSDEELRARMSICHIGIIPSMSEGFCYTAVQMQAMGLSLIASNVGALPEVLDHGNTILIPYGKVEALKNTLIQKLTKPIRKTATTVKKQIDYTNYYHLFE